MNSITQQKLLAFILITATTSMTYSSASTPKLPYSLKPGEVKKSSTLNGDVVAMAAVDRLIREERERAEKAKTDALQVEKDKTAATQRALDAATTAHAQALQKTREEFTARTRESQALAQTVAQMTQDDANHRAAMARLKEKQRRIEEKIAAARAQQGVA